METVSATDLARRTRAILDRVVTSGETVEIERNNVVVARLVPPEASMTAAQALTGLARMLTPEQGANWLRDSREEFGESVRDPWA
jgi:antitoxin (DNA-binding transcriptional repressor) of toxin-antitoxin stability system